MTFKEMNLAVFERKPLPHVFFQPRFEPWLAYQKQFGNLSARYRDAEVRDVYRDVGCSMRYLAYYNDAPYPLETHYTPEVVIEDTQDGDTLHRVFKTPKGILTSRHQKTQDDTWREVEFLAKTPSDLRALIWVLERSQVRFDAELFRQGSEYMGDLGEPQFFLPKSPYQALAQTFMKLEDLVYALADDRAVVEAAMEAIDRSYDSLYSDLTDSPTHPLSDSTHPWPKILNVGENLHEQLISPAIFEDYYLPWYERRMSQLRQAGIFTYIHIDGYFKNLMPRLKDMPFDGIEALTPKPQGDLELDAIAEHLGDKILLDGIPAVLFMDTYPEEELMHCVERIVELFHPRLVLGISDELPEICGEEGIERVRRVSEWCKKARTSS
ncbi:MAG: hypothetical protein HZC36_00120 [Armatimonadetes bacterium]|nr:hypothetical protein [Armatimonadota bacterium]